MLKDLIRRLWRNFFIEPCIIFLIVFPPLIYGSLTILPLSLLLALSFLTSLVFVIKLSLEKQISLVKIRFLPILLFISLVIFQLIPLPRGLLSTLSYSTVSLYQDFGANPSDFLTLSIYPEATANILLQLLAFLSFFLVVLNYVDTEKKARRLIFAIIICGFLYSFYGIIRKLYMPLPLFSTFTNRNHFAGYIEMIIPLGITYSLIEESRSRKPVLIFMVSVMILALLLTLSRAGVFSLCLSIIFLFLALGLKRPLQKWIGIFIFSILILFILLAFIGRDPFIAKMSSILTPFKAYSPRFKIIKDCLKIIMDFPLFGTGFGTFGEIFQKYKTFKPHFVVNFSFAHNEPIQFMAETGILGFLLMGFFLLLYIKNIFRFWLKRHNNFAVYMTLGCLAGLLSIGLHSLFDFVFHIPANAFLFFVILALVYRVVHLKKSQEDPLILPKHEFLLSRTKIFITIVLFSMAFIFIESVIWKRYKAEALYEEIEKKTISKNSIEAVLGYKKILKEVDMAAALNPLNSIYLSKKADLFSEIALRDDLKDYLSSIEGLGSPREILALSADLYKKAIDINPTRADYHLKLGWLYSILGKPEMAQQEFDKAVALDPQNTNIRSYINDYLGPVKSE